VCSCGEGSFGQDLAGAASCLSKRAVLVRHSEEPCAPVPAGTGTAIFTHARRPLVLTPLDYRTHSPKMLT
jgi:hypothetical protein